MKRLTVQEGTDVSMVAIEAVASVFDSIEHPECRAAAMRTAGLELARRADEIENEWKNDGAPE